ncbi:hypothetical protein Fot_04213 [Forsythia ovata]|uniref:Uncharacterized protein n=1 Tax=Forsythia ovata TaxID=205694 RepID=A0ABD1XC17_9LAMI
MLEMRVAKIQSALGEDENAEAMRAEIKRLRARLAFSEDAQSRAMYDVTKAQTIQKACIVAQKKAESQLKSCQNMIQAKDRELTEVLNELAKAKGLLAKLGVPGYTETCPSKLDKVGKGFKSRKHFGLVQPIIRQIYKIPKIEKSKHVNNVQNLQCHHSPFIRVRYGSF